MITKFRHTLASAVALLVGFTAHWVSANGQANSAPVPYKLGTFAAGGQPFLGLVLRDEQVVDIAKANSSWQAQHPAARRMTAPADMKQLIADYESGWHGRLADIARAETNAASAAAYSYSLDKLKILPPVAPAVVLNANSNYEEHLQAVYKLRASQGRPRPTPPDPTSIPSIWDRKPGDTRANPNMFLKSPSVITGATDPIYVPRGRDHIDWECEFDLVIGKSARHVPSERAADYIFGYTIQIDVSDRDRTGVADGVDWTIMKNHDSFAPLGPVIVPKEFLPNPMNVRQKFTLNGEVMQDSNTSRMSYTIYELLSYSSNLMTLHAGDVISAGSPAGTNVEREKPRWMRDGDVAVCSIEGIGTQTHPVKNEPVSNAK